MTSEQKNVLVTFQIILKKWGPLPFCSKCLYGLPRVTPSITNQTIYDPEVWDRIAVRLWGAATKGDNTAFRLLQTWRKIFEALKSHLDLNLIPPVCLRARERMLTLQIILNAIGSPTTTIGWGFLLIIVPDQAPHWEALSYSVLLDLRRTVTPMPPCEVLAGTHIAQLIYSQAQPVPAVPMERGAQGLDPHGSLTFQEF